MDLVVDVPPAVPNKAPQPTPKSALARSGGRFSGGAVELGH